MAPELVARYAAFQGGERILLRRLGPVRRRVALIPGIQRAVVRRVLPSRVVIEVVEGGPLVRLQGRAELGVDEAGVIFPPPGGAGSAACWGALGGRADLGRRLDAGTRRGLRAFGGFPRELGQATERVEVGEEEVRLWLGGEMAVRLGRAEGLGVKAQAARGGAAGPGPGAFRWRTWTFGRPGRPWWGNGTLPPGRGLEKGAGWVVHRGLVSESSPHMGVCLVGRWGA